MAKKKLDWAGLDALLQFKVSKGFCADYLGISEDTIDRRIKSEHNMTFTQYREYKCMGMGLKLQQKAIQMALAGNATMLIFSLKNLAGWSDKSEKEINSDKEILKLAYGLDNANSKTN